MSVRNKDQVRQDVIDELSPGCHFFEVGRFFFEVCPMDVFVTHQSGESMCFSLDKVETRRHQHRNTDNVDKFDSTTVRIIEGKICDMMIGKVGGKTVSCSKLSWMPDGKKGSVFLAKIAAKGEYDHLVEAVKESGNKYLQKSMVEAYNSYEESYKRFYKKKEEENEKNKWYWKQHATWKTEEGALEYMFGDGEDKEYSISQLESDVTTKLEMVITFIDDISTFERYDRFSNSGAQEFMSDSGYDCGCGEGFNIFDTKESFENAAKSITLPITDDEMDISEWCSNGISIQDLDNLRLGLSPEDDLPEHEMSPIVALAFIEKGLTVIDVDEMYKYKLGEEDDIYKFNEDGGETIEIHEFLDKNIVLKVIPTY